MAHQPIVVVTDSASAIPYPLLIDYNVRVVPMHISIDQELYSEGVNISPPRVVSALLSGSKIRTFEPPAAEFTRIYRACADAGAKEIVSIHASGKILKVIETAKNAAATSPIPVTVVDSATIGMAQGWIVLAAAAVAQYSTNAEDVAEAARRAAETSRLFFTVDTMKYLHRDGQVPAIIKTLSNAVHMRPILSIKNGDIALTSRVRHTAPAREQVRSMMQDYASTLARPAVAVALIGGNAFESGLGIETTGLILEESPGASLTAHAGPGTYAVAVADMPKEFMLEA